MDRRLATTSGVLMLPVASQMDWNLGASSCSIKQLYPAILNLSVDDEGSRECPANYHLRALELPLPVHPHFCRPRWVDVSGANDQLDSRT
jgi:hypothetical protein